MSDLFNSLGSKLRDKTLSRLTHCEFSAHFSSKSYYEYSLFNFPERGTNIKLG